MVAGAPASSTHVSEGAGLPEVWAQFPLQRLHFAFPASLVCVTGTFCGHISRQASVAPRGCCLASSHAKEFLCFREIFCATLGALLERLWRAVWGAPRLLGGGGGPLLPRVEGSGQELWNPLRGSHKELLLGSVLPLVPRGRRQRVAPFLLFPLGGGASRK